MIGCLRTRVRKQPIITFYFEFENELKIYNLGARPTGVVLFSLLSNFLIFHKFDLISILINFIFSIYFSAILYFLLFIFFFFFLGGGGGGGGSLLSNH